MVSARPRRLSALAIVVFAAGGGAACDDAASPYFGSTRRVARDAATFYVNNGTEPEYLDPGKSNDTASTALVAQLFEGLTRYHPDDAHPVQGVARTWERSDDNRLYRFHLRPEARWSDGRPVTAGDFEYAWKRVLRPATASRAASDLYVLENGELFRLGKLQALREGCHDGGSLPNPPAQGCHDGGSAPKPPAQGCALLAEPHLGSAESERLPAGTAVHIVERAGGWALVERWSKLPTYRPTGVAPIGSVGGEAPSPAAALPPPLRGWVPEADLVEDDRVLGVRATDDLTLEVELENPAPYFLDLTGSHAFAPVRRDVIEPFEQRGEGDRWTRPESLVSNGPYVLDRWDFQYQITMKANPFYWDRSKLAITHIVWLEVQDYHASMNLYKAGELDYLGDNVPVPAEYQALLTGKKDYQRSDFLSVGWYELNTRKPPLDDVRVRRALDLAIDKQLLVDRITRGGQRPATHYVPDFTGSGYAEEVAAERDAGADPFADRHFDPSAARALLAEAGHAPVREGDGWRATGLPPIEILYNTGEGNRQVAVAVQAMWRENLGVSVTLRSQEWKVMLKTYRDGNFQVMRFGQTAVYDHPNTFLELFSPGNPQNLTGWRDEAFDRTLAQASATADPRESIRLYRAAEAIAVAGMARIPLYFYTRSSLVKPWVKGFRGSRHNAHAIQFLRIDPEWQAHAGSLDGGSAPKPPAEGSPDTPAYLPPELPPPGPYLP